MQSTIRSFTKRLSVVIAAFALMPQAAMALQCHVGTITFHKSGGLKSCQIEGNHEFRTEAGLQLKCRSGELVTQYPDGGIESCSIAEPHTFGDVTCAPGRVELNLDGSLRQCE